MGRRPRAPLFVVVIGALGYPFFRRVMGFDATTVFHSAMPGGLQDMPVFGAEAGGDIRAMCPVHAARVLVIVTVAPLLMSLLYGAELVVAHHLTRLFFVILAAPVVGRFTRGRDGRRAGEAPGGGRGRGGWSGAQMSFRASRM